jgi:hypothetical protein
MRPPGEIAQALRSAAFEPGTVRQLCERAQVGYVVGQYTACRMVQRGELLPVDTVPARGAGPGRKAAVLVAAEAHAADPAAADLGAAMRSFWEQPLAVDLT